MEFSSSSLQRAYLTSHIEVKQNPDAGSCHGLLQILQTLVNLLFVQHANDNDLKTSENKHKRARTGTYAIWFKKADFKAFSGGPKKDGPLGQG